ETRVKVFVPCSFLMSRERAMELTGPSDGCSQMPGEGSSLLEMNDFLLASAPKPVLVLAGRYDFIDYNGTVKAFEEMKRVYQSLGHPERVQLFSYDDGHGISFPKRAAAVSWFRKWFYHDSSYKTEIDLPVLTAKELMVTTTGQVATSFTNEVSITQRNLNLYNSLAGERKKFLSGPAQE